MRSGTSSTALPIASIVTSGAIFGTLGAAREIGLPDVPAAVVGGGRVVIAAAAFALLAAVAIATRRFDLRILREQWVAVLVSGAAVAAYQVFFFGAMATTGVAVGTMVTLGLAPVWTGVVAAVIGQHRPSRVWAAATLVAAVGCAFLLWEPQEAVVDPFGVLLAAAAALCWGVQTVAHKSLLLAGTPRLLVIGSAFVVGGVILAPFLVTGVDQVSRPGQILTLVYLGAVATVAAYLLFVHALDRLPAPRTATFALVEPLAAVLLGIALLGESVSARMAVGSVALLAGLVVVGREREVDPDRVVAEGGHP